MLSAVKISDLPLHPKSTNPEFIDLNHIIPVLGESGGVWTTYKAPLSAAVPAINITATATPVNSFDPPTVNVIPGAYRNSYELDFEIPQGQVPSLTSVTILSVGANDPMAHKAIVTPIPPNKFEIQFYLPPGPQGPRGTQGTGINFKGRRSSYAQLTNLTLTPFPSAGDAWFVDVDETQTPPASGVFYMRGENTSGVVTWLSGGPLIGPEGPKGDSGFAAAFNNPVTTTLSAGMSATVTKATLPDNSVTLTFGIPQGLSGISPVLSADPVALSAVFGTAPSVQTLGTAARPVFKFTIPQGPTGLQGLSGITPTLAVGSVSALSAGSMPFIRPAAGSALGNLTIDFGIPMGRTPVVMVGSVSALSAGATPIVQTTTSSDNLSSTLSFGIPVGRAATVSITTPTLSAPFGNQPQVTNTGSTSAASFQFTIPAGQPGDWTTPQTVSNYTTLQANDLDAGKIFLVTGAATIAVPANCLTLGKKIDFIKTTTDAVAFQAAVTGGGTVYGTPSLIFRSQWSAASLIRTKTSPVEYVLVGDLQ